ncbi:MAG: heparinase II/III family protein [Lentisphaeria bacterium]|jgi:hypothetical protein
MPQNILRTPLDPPAIERVLASTRGRPLLPPLGDPAWEKAARRPLAQGWIEELKRLAGQELAEPLPELTAALYADFARTGNRLNFEHLYFERRRRLGRAAICALLETDAAARGRWLESTVAKLRAVFAEVSWALPAHVANPTGQDPRRLDLFAAETANLMGEMLTLFGEALPAELSTAMTARLRRDVFDNYLEHPEENWWTTLTNNWNAVCHQGVVGAALAVEEDAGRLARLLALAARFLPTYLGGFTPDGGTGEGPGYWEYGFGWFSTLNEQLENRTAGQLSLFEGDPLIRKIARYSPLMCLSHGWVVNFADCGPRQSTRAWLPLYLGGRLGEEACLATARAQYRHLARTGINWQEERCDLLYLARNFLHAPEEIPAEAATVPEDAWFPDLGVLVARGRDRTGHLWEFAAKAGHNAEHHNHNDCGSYLLNLDGERLLIEIGAPEYTRDFFGPKRYESLAARTLGHSLPLINGCEQAAGQEFAARVLAESHSGTEARLVLDLTHCYPPAARCQEYVRTLRLDKAAGRLEVADQFVLEAALPVETALITEAKAVAEGGGVAIAGKTAQLRVTPAEGTVVGEIQVHGYRDHDGAAAEVRRVVLRPKAPAARLALAYTLTAG